MEKISAKRYVEGVNSIYVEQPEYMKGHDGSDGKCDCIGMCRGALIRENVTDVENMRGTNQAARKAIRNLREIESENQLRIGDVVLKSRHWDDPNMPLPDKYREGGSDYDPKWGLTNFTHIGTVTGIKPLEITHMTSPTAKKDEKLKGWFYVGSLPWVEYDAEDQQQTQPEPIAETAIVVAESGSAVKMRAKPSASCKLYWDVPVGSEVTLDEYGENWSRITWKNRMGYMMTKFLQFGDFTVIIPGLTREQAEAICQQWPRATMEQG